jgi:hypothetical protein
VAVLESTKRRGRAARRAVAGKKDPLRGSSDNQDPVKKKVKAKTN